MTITEPDGTSEAGQQEPDSAPPAAQADGAWERLKACRQETCGWLFYDASRNRSSNWCSMQVCGGREKSRAYRRRHAGREDA